MVRVDDGIFESSQARALEYIVAGDTKSAITLVSSLYVHFPGDFNKFICLIKGFYTWMAELMQIC